MALAGIAVVFLLWPKPEAAPAMAKAPEQVCAITGAGDLQGILGRLVNDPQACVEQLKNGLPVAVGDGQSAYFRFDGSGWDEVGQSVQDPRVKDYGIQMFSYGSVSVTVTVHDVEGRSLFAAQATRGQAALLRLDYTTGAHPTGVTIDDSEAGTFEIPLK